jgi:hypothetical protein
MQVLCNGALVISGLAHETTREPWKFVSTALTIPIVPT